MVGRVYRADMAARVLGCAESSTGGECQGLFLICLGRVYLVVI